MLYKTDNQIKMILGINAWRNLLNDKIIRFAAMMPEMNLDLMMEIIGQLPQFWLFAKSSLKKIEKLASLRQDSEQSRKLAEISRLLDNDLDFERNSATDKQFFLETILQAVAADAQPQVLSEDDRLFVSGLRDSQAHSTRNMLVAALTFIGGRLSR